ncbi:MAG: ABC transporter permease [Blastocatellia bacterium]|nr:ABC transporter permease [Blastocatellia bacterium]
MRGTNGVEAMAIFAFFPAQISYINGKKDFSVVKQTNAEYWEVFDFDFVEGDGFTKDEVNNASNVAVINESKKESFFQDKSAIGQTITVQHKTYRVVGVVKNTSPLRQATYADIWISMTPPVNVVQKKDLTGNFSAVLLAKSRADIPLIREEFQSAVKRVDLSGYKGINSFSVNLNNTVEQLARLYINAKVEEPAPVNKLLSYITLITVLFVILPTVNLISINTNRIMERASEIGVRKAFGASSWTLTLQFLIENTILTTLGAILALLVTRFIFWLMNGTYLLFSADLEINYRVFFSGLVITLIFSLISGVYPAWRMSGLPPALALKGGAK